MRRWLWVRENGSRRRRINTVSSLRLFLIVEIHEWMLFFIERILLVVDVVHFVASRPFNLSLMNILKWKRPDEVTYQCPLYLPYQRSYFTEYDTNETRALEWHMNNFFSYWMLIRMINLCREGIALKNQCIWRIYKTYSKNYSLFFCKRQRH